MSRMQIAAPAKINLNLRVLRRNEATGYHDLETWMVPITVADELRVELTETPGIVLTCSDPELDSGSGNLAWKAADLFLHETGHSGGARIELHKHIPHGAGLGGGSGDAAAVLKALNEQTGRKLGETQLLELAAELGSDVPFFMGGKGAMARGRGEILTGKPLPTPLDLLLLKPPFPVPTAWAYKRYAEMKASEAGMLPQESQWLGDVEITNDLEVPVFGKYLLLPVMKEWLCQQPGVESAFMTGSGSTMVAVIAPDAPTGCTEGLKQRIASEYGPTMWICKTGWGIGDGE